MKSHVRWLSHFLLVGGFLLLSYPVAVWVFADGFQVYQKWAFDRSRAMSPGIQTTDQPKPLPHAVVGRIEIPRLDLSAMVLEGVEDRDLLVGAGHIPGTALPGEEGNVGIAAHRDTFFRSLRRIAKNDQILLTTLGGSFKYLVASIEITTPDNPSVLQDSAQPTLTLITCYPFSFVGPAPDRFVVHAYQVL